ncbi:MAG: hydrogenase nickel incorporation protein HypA/HybF [Pseudonocardiales bacterium]|jgi:hydrogenase nickel incorporation protein HypA/HybF|nr:hydrogenase nickel incorporation protein HypA/HybF [Pseudonocardiales bacterium]
MHELSICGSIADIVARRAPGRRVTKIHVQIGQLRQIVPDTLVYCWSMVSAETQFDGAELVVDRVPARIRCRDCEETTEVGDIPLLVCTACNGISVSVVSGEEFMVTSMDLAEV